MNNNQNYRNINWNTIFFNIRNGWTYKQFIEEYGFKNKEEVEQIIRQRAHTKTVAENHIAILRKNSHKAKSTNPKKHPQKGKKAKTVTSPLEIDETQPTTAETEDLLPKTQENVPTEMRVEENLHIEEFNLDPLDKLIARLLAEEEELSNSVISLESQHRTTKAKVLAIRKQLVAIDTDVNELIAKLTAKYADISNLSIELENCSTQLRTLTGELNTKSLALSEVRNQLDSLKKVVIWVYDNAEIFIENGEKIPVDLYTEEQLKEAVPAIILSEEARKANINVHEAYAIAKVRIIIKYLKENNVSFEFMFDNPDLKDFV